MRGKNGKFASAEAANDNEVAEAATPVKAANDNEAGAAAPSPARPARKREAPAGKAKTARNLRWPKEKEAIFFRELAIVCNVSAALRAAGLLRQSRSVYDRRSDPAFRARWEEALAESRVLMALELHERARFGDQRPEPENDIERKLRAVPTTLALQLLKLYEARAARAAVAVPAQAPRPRDPEGRRERRRALLERLAEFNRRMGGEG
ncbi:MAG: hypothetical protein JO013_05515 [Alphaproteobacteria bacterium]|nr:hypothetical protein [Alphaproteobacteria bacterium]